MLLRSQSESNATVQFGHHGKGQNRIAAQGERQLKIDVTRVGRIPEMGIGLRNKPVKEVSTRSVSIDVCQRTELIRYYGSKRVSRVRICFYRGHTVSSILSMLYFLLLAPATRHTDRGCTR